MNLAEYQNKALRTESRVEKIVLNKNELNHLLGAFITISEILDGVKKKAFYNNPKKYNEKYNELSQSLHHFNDCSDRHHGIEDDEDLKVDPRVFHGLLGILTEAGELAEHLMKMINHNDVDAKGIFEEIADGAWYTAILADTLNESWEQALVNNIDKLKIRFPEKYSDYHAENRDLVSERIELEKNA